jgi:hypothetical protein
MHIRSDISYSMRVMIKYCVNSSELHCQLIEKIFRYLVDTISLKLTFKKSSISNDLIEYSDSNFASHMNDRKFISEYVFLLAEIAISHSFKLQNTVALSITEVEYMTLCEATKETIWIARLLWELYYRSTNKSVLIRENNKRVNALITNSEFHRRIKHIKMRWHWIREQITKRKIHLEYISIKLMIADDLIKSLSVSDHRNFRDMIDLTKS